MSSMKHAIQALHASLGCSCCIDSKVRPVNGLQEEEERRRRVKEVAYDLQRRVKQELAYPAVIHFYSWLLQGIL